MGQWRGNSSNMFGLVVIFRLFTFEECWQTVCELTYYKCKFVLYLIIYYLCSYLAHDIIQFGRQLWGSQWQSARRTPNFFEDIIQLAKFKLLGSTMRQKEKEHLPPPIQSQPTINTEISFDKPKQPKDSKDSNIFLET